MKGLNSAKPIAQRRMLIQSNGTAARLLYRGIPLALGCFVISGATLFSKALPLAACVVAALPMGIQPLLAACGAIAGYFLRCEAAVAAEYAALTLLMLAAVAVFQGTRLPVLRWFMPAMAASVSAILGGICILGGSVQWSFLLAKVLLAGAATAAFRKALAGNRCAEAFLAVTLVSGFSGFGFEFDLGIVAACALCITGEDLLTAALTGLALDLTGAYGQCALPALMLPALFQRFLHPKDRFFSAVLFFTLSAAVFFCFDRLTMELLAATFVGSLSGAIWLRFMPMRLNAQGTEQLGIRLEEAADTLELLRKHLPEEAFTASPNEAEDVYDAAAERVCRCCPRFHRCWEQRAAATYDALSCAAHRIIERGIAEMEDFSPDFRENCCHLEGFVLALNQELEGMLYRRRYRMQLRESRQVMAEELSCLAQYLRAVRDAPQHAQEECVFLPQVGICTLGKNGSRVSGDRGAYFSGTNADFYVLLCDGMGTGTAAAVSSGETVRLLQRLLKSGLAPEAALKIFNGTEVLRGTGCYTTVDLLRIDLNSGSAKLYKWGAAPSYLRHFDTVKKLGTATTPPGVGMSYSPEQYSLSLKHGQLLTLVTDGADGQQVHTVIGSYRGQSPRELAALLIASAQADDDMTAVVVSLQLRDQASQRQWNGK